jgi:hypothetical protein
VPDLRKLNKLLDPEIRAKNVQALGWALRERWYDVARPAMPDPVFLVGCSRSGTTVSYETLAAAPQFIKFGYELPQFWDSLYGPLNNGWQSEAATADDAHPAHRYAALRHFYARLGPGLVLDKTCINVMRVPYLLKLFPQARFVFIHRDGRDNISSLIDGWRFDGHFRMDLYLGPPPEPVAIESGAFTDWSFFYPPGWRDWNRATLAEVCAHQWLSANRLALQARRLVPACQWIQMRYEDIFERPLEMFRTAFDRLDVPFTDALRQRCANLQPTSIVKGQPRKQKWKEQNPQEVERILPMIRAMQAELGYDTA